MPTFVCHIPIVAFFGRNCDFSGPKGVLPRDDLESIGLLARLTLQIDFYGLSIEFMQHRLSSVVLKVVVGQWQPRFA